MTKTHLNWNFFNSIKKVLTTVRVSFVLLIAGILQLGAIEVYAQSQVTGTVASSTGEPLPGVNVTVKGTTVGVMTDMNGNFTITPPNSQAVLVFSFIGFEPQEITVGSQTRINVTLAESMQMMDEVVVTALGIRKEKKALSYAVQDVKGDAFTAARMNNVATSLSGKIAGVDATQSNSGAGASSRVIIRGNTSLAENTNQQPLYVVDGMPINNTNKGALSTSTGLNVDRGDGISSINPDDIESISILKGGAAAALYGSQASNGVVLITTKRGTARQGIGVEINSDVNFGFPSVFPNYQYEYGQGDDGVKPKDAAKAKATGRLSYGARIDGSNSIQFDGVERPYTAVNVKDNIKNFYQTAVNMSNTVAFNAGNEDMQVRLSFSDTRAREQQPNSNFYRKTVNMNARAALGQKDIVIIETSAQYNLVDGINRPNVGYAELNAAWPVYLAANTVDVRNMKGTDPNMPGINAATGRELEWNPVPAALNPYYAAYQIRNEDHRQRFLGRTSVQVNLHPKVFIKGTAATDYTSFQSFNYVPMTSAFTPLGYRNSDKEMADQTNFQVIGNYNDKFFSDNIGLNLMVGAYSERNKLVENEEDGSEWIMPNFFSPANLKKKDLFNKDEERRGTNSLFGEINLDWRSIAFLTLSGRKDWFSVLNPDNNSIFYPAIGGSLIVSQIVDLPAFFNFAKIRASWAQVGGATVDPGAIYQTYGVNVNNVYGLASISNPNRIFNSNLVPLSSATTEGGFQIQFFDNRLGLDVNRYVKKTTNDMLMPPISGTTGYRAGAINMGLITNKGWEISLTGTPITKNNFNWDVTFNFSYNKNEIVELAEGLEYLTVGDAIGGVSLINAVGLPYSTVRAYVMQRDENGTLIYDEATRRPARQLAYLGTGVPPSLLGLNNTFSYKNFTLTVDIDSKLGAVGYSNLMQYATRFGLTPMTLPGRDNGLVLEGVKPNGDPYTTTWTVETLDSYYDQVGNNYQGDLFVYNTDFVKLRRAVLRYNLPSKITRALSLEGASVAVTGINLLTLYQDKAVKDAGIDPEMQQTVGNAQGSQGVAMPVTRNIGFNVNIRF
jgi:TonB-linked SusC/RagA family outer membrane protein